MEYIFNKEKLERVLSDFYNSTGIAVALYDASQNSVAASPVLSPYCTYIRRQGGCEAHCSRSNLIQQYLGWRICRRFVGLPIRAIAI